MTGPEEERARRDALHDLERWAARQPEQPGPDRPDKITVMRVRLHGQRGVEAFYLARWSLVARLCRDAEGSGDELEDLGPDALLIARAAQRGEWMPGELAEVGIAKDGRWVRWNPPSPVEPVPGSAGEQAQRN
jgi:hypothetical protein